MRVGAVVVTYNSADYVIECVKSLQLEEIENIVIVDNASDEAMADLAEKLPVKFISNKENLGFAKACNIGAAQLNTDKILFINPDARLRPGSLKIALSAFDEVTAVVGLGLADNEGRLEADSHGDDVTLTNMWRRKMRDDFEEGLGEAQEVDWVSGGAMLVQSKAFRAVGGFDEDYFMYWEDVDLCKRLRERRWKIVWQPKAKVHHHRGASLGSSSARTKYYDQSADKYFRKHYSTSIWFLQRLLRWGYRLLSPLAH